MSDAAFLAPPNIPPFRGTRGEQPHTLRGGVVPSGPRRRHDSPTHGYTGSRECVSNKRRTGRLRSGGTGLTRRKGEGQGILVVVGLRR